ncbi:unnamed protein product [Ixodes pacificus]
MRSVADPPPRKKLSEAAHNDESSGGCRGRDRSKNNSEEARLHLQDTRCTLVVVVARKYLHRFIMTRTQRPCTASSEYLYIYREFFYFYFFHFSTLFKTKRGGTCLS